MPFECTCTTQAVDGTNPRHLRHEIHRLQNQLFDLPLARGPAEQWLIPPDEDK
jgi:hypothetical protein